MLEDGAGAAGAAGVLVAAGAGVAGTAGAGFSLGCFKSVSFDVILDTRMAQSYLIHHAHHITLLLDIVGGYSLFILQDLACMRVSYRYRSTMHKHITNIPE